MTRTWKKSRCLYSQLPLTTLIMSPSRIPQSQAALPPQNRHWGVQTALLPVSLQLLTPFHGQATPAASLPPSSPPNVPASATSSSAQLPSKTILWESHCMTFWLKNKAIRLGKVLTRRLFYCCGSDITAMLLSVLLTSHECHLTLTGAREWKACITYRQ